MIIKTLEKTLHESCASFIDAICIDSPRFISRVVSSVQKIKSPGVKSARAFTTASPRMKITREQVVSALTSTVN